MALTELEHLGLGHATQKILLEQVLVRAVGECADGELICLAVELRVVSAGQHTHRWRAFLFWPTTSLGIDRRPTQRRT